MIPPYKVSAALTVVFPLSCVIISYFAGYYTAYDRIEESFANAPSLMSLSGT